MVKQALGALAQDMKGFAQQLRAELANQDDTRAAIIKRLSPRYLISVATDNTRGFCDWQQFSQWPQSSQW